MSGSEFPSRGRSRSSALGSLTGPCSAGMLQRPCVGGLWQCLGCGHSSQQKWVGFTLFPSVSLLSPLPPSGYLVMRSLFVPSQVAAPDLRQEQRLLLSRVLAPKLLGFAGNPSRLSGALGVPELGRTGQGGFSLLLLLPVLHPAGIHV